MATAVSSKSAKSKKPTDISSKRASRAAGGPSEDDIRILAYHLYERRREDGAAGDADSDWIEAERQLTGDRG